MNKLFAKKFRNHKTKFRVKDVEIGGKGILIIAGPCSIKDKNTLDLIATKLNEMNIKAIRGGVFKPRTSLYSFQGLGEKGLKILHEVSQRHRLISVTEIITSEQIPLLEKYSDIIQVGTRNMMNYHLLKLLGKSKKPVLLKRGMWATYEEWLYAAEYLLYHGNPKVILCERGIVSFDKSTRNVLDIMSVEYLKRKTHLPIFIDPSHATGRRELIFAAAMAAIAVGADGLLIEASHNPYQELSDKRQTITLNTLRKIVEKGDLIAKTFNSFIS